MAIYVHREETFESTFEFTAIWLPFMQYIYRTVKCTLSLNLQTDLQRCPWLQHTCKMIQAAIDFLHAHIIELIP